MLKSTFKLKKLYLMPRDINVDDVAGEFLHGA